MNKTKHRFFIALLPPQHIQDCVNEIKQHCADCYDSRAAQKSPPHITLQAPFEWEDLAIPVLENRLRQFAADFTAVPVTLSGFGAFPPRVIYVNVLKTPELLAIQKALIADLETALAIVDAVAKNRPFAPHMTVAFRDLTKANFRTAWAEFHARSLNFDFTATHLTLLIHDGKRWQIHSEYPFKT